MNALTAIRNSAYITRDNITGKYANFTEVDCYIRLFEVFHRTTHHIVLDRICRILSKLSRNETSLLKTRRRIELLILCIGFHMRRDLTKYNSCQSIYTTLSNKNPSPGDLTICFEIHIIDI